MNIFTSIFLAAVTAAFPPCVTEEASPENPPACVWNAETQGNGQGESFIDIDGTAIYIVH